MTQLTEDIPPVLNDIEHGRVIVAAESDEHDGGPIRWAERYARFHQRPLVVAHTYSTPPPTPHSGLTGDGWIDQRPFQAAASHVAGSIVDRLREHGLDVSAMTIQDNAGTGLVSIAHREDVLVAGTDKGGAVRHFLRGGTVHTLLRHAPCPVVVVPCAWRNDLSDGRRPIVVGYDGTDRSKVALRWAAREAALFRAPLEAIHGVMPDPAGMDLASAATAAGRIAEDVGVTVDVRSVTTTTDGIARSLTTVARGAEMLVLGNHRASWFAALAAYSVPERIVLEPLCPVAVIPFNDPTQTAAVASVAQV